MRGKILIVTGLAVGYVLGARAGRERYEQIKSAAIKFWNDPRVQQQVETVEDFAKDKAPDVVDFISDNAKKVVTKARSTKKSNTSTPNGSKSASASTPASGARKNSGTSSSSTTK